nr:MAG TPA: hypothetical protein [Caudoviricetes sp.]
MVPLRHLNNSTKALYVYTYIKTLPPFPVMFKLPFR